MDPSSTFTFKVSSVTTMKKLLDTFDDKKFKLLIRTECFPNPTKD